jgi:nicotinate dehydrogenase subunit A
MPTASTLNISLNGVPKSVALPDNTEPLLQVLHNRLNQLGPKFGCGVSQCGACTVLVNGIERRACVLPSSAVPSGAAVTTLDGLAPPTGSRTSALHPMQQAFVDEQAAQCAFCSNGFIMGSVAWLNRRFAAGNKATPTDNEVKLFLAGKDFSATGSIPPGSTAPNVYICRCGAHTRIIKAIQRGAQEMAK